MAEKTLFPGVLRKGGLDSTEMKVGTCKTARREQK